MDYSLRVLLLVVTYTAVLCCGFFFFPNGNNVLAQSSIVLHKPIVGGNLDGVSDYSRTLNFIDAMKTCRKFGSANAPWDGNASLDADGWPIGLSAGAIVFTALDPGGAVNGTYYFQGDGPLELSLVASPGCTLSNFIYSPTTGKTTGYVHVDSTATQLMLAFSQTNSSKAFRNLRLIRPGYSIQDADDKIFTKFLENDIAPMKILRFMDWGHTNGNQMSKWSDRAKLSDATYSIKGAPYELMIELANRYNKEIWVNIPVRADDDYITQMAKLFKAKLNPNAIVYIEYSNELWNSGFEQFNYNVNEAEKMVLQQNNTVLNYDNVNNKYTWSFRRTGYRSMQISDIFAREFGEEKRNVQFRVVLAGQAANSYIVNQGLRVVERNFGPPQRYFYAIAGAPYFQIKNANETLTSESAFQILKTEAEKSPLIYQYMNHLCLCKYYGLKCMAYEGGPDTFGPFNIPEKKEASKDPRMRQVVINFLNDWFSYGFDAFLWFTIGHGSYDTQYGTWGWVDSMLSGVTSPKKEGILYVASQTNGIPLNYTIFRTVSKSEMSIPAIHHALAGGNSQFSYLASPAVNSTFHYPLIFSTRGYFNISIEIQNLKPKSELDIYLNQIRAGTLIFNNQNSIFNVTTLSPNIVIEKGMTVITLLCRTDRAYNINTVKVQLVTDLSDPLPSPKISPTTTRNTTAVSMGMSCVKGHQVKTLVGMMTCQSLTILLAWSVWMILIIVME
ncbi:hypothetical protein C9374_009976 [Naegleria lovaniensis]|uniref:Uncharacterized protein n=1 Tax=Naegleria lovaniensis TaxID=51637 RepID=A0AA88GHL1_NAELO|nr:uncharacterized protein C9374_009976 [Naegleria lovaniensis]KAG2375353.1 hypothetical protein C9374_009976 [Naegleria lovaniensis]